MANSFIDSLISELDKTLKVLATRPVSNRKTPSYPQSDQEITLSEKEKKETIGMMRINHVGEICAQALYQAQAFSTKDANKQRLFRQAAQEENDHLAWTQDRLTELGGKPSLLNPFWYGASFVLGLAAGKMGEKVSLGFMAETEKQVERHLNSHLDRLSPQDHRSRAILEQMRQDEIEHGQTALQHGGSPLPLPVRLTMSGMSKVMTTLAKHI
jgi:ubiquinone biosynthesis monooxygenase Coq7